MKRFTCLNMLLASLLMLVSANVSAYDFEYEGIYYSIISTGELTCAVVKGDVEYSGEVIIPEVVEYKGRQLTPIKIEEGAFKDCVSLKNVKTNTSISVIGNSAFQGCVNLQELTLHSTITDIGEYAFAGCVNLEDPNVVNTSITTISEHMFDGCSKLTEVLMPKTIIWIYDYAFKDCVGLTKFTFPNVSGLPIYWQPTIYLSAFVGCTSLKDLVFEDSDRELSFDQPYNEEPIKAFNDSPIENVYLGRYISGNDLFRNKSSLRYVEINAPTKLTSYTFADCTNLESVIIGDDVPSISEYCFSGCSNLSDVHIGTSVTTIGHYAFDGCSNINSFTIPKNVIYLGQAFYGCTGLENLIIEDGDEDLIFGIDYYITNPQYFKDSPIKTLYLGRNTAYRYTYANPTPPFSNLTQLKEVTIGNPVTMIKDYGFTNCSSLENITISANVAKIGENAFEGCSNLSNIYSLNPIPPQGAGSAGFTKDQYVGDVVVYVPKGSLQSYLNDNGWKNFWDIREFETTGIDNIQTSGVKDVVEIARYSIDGRRLSVPQKGLNIVVMSDGSKRKVMVK